MGVRIRASGLNASTSALARCAHYASACPSPMERLCECISMSRTDEPSLDFDFVPNLLHHPGWTEK